MLRYIWDIWIVVGILALAFIVAEIADADQCNISWCVDPSIPWSGAGHACAEGAGFDIAGNPRQLRWGDQLGCPPGAWGFGVDDPASGERVPISDRLVACEEVARLCPWAPIVPEVVTPVPPKPPTLILR